MVRWTKRSEKSNAEIMDFENVNSMNRQLNLISGNLFPMTANGFTIGWRIYSIAVWLLMTVECIAFFSGCAMVPKEKNINNGMTVMLFNVEVFSLITRIHVKRGLIMQFIRGMNDSLRTRDKIMKRIVMKVVRQMQTPIKFYLLIGQLTMTIWILLPLGEIGKKSFFSYVDYKIPNAISKQPFSAMTFVLGIMLTLFADVYLLTKKLSLDSYVVHMVQLMTAQYQYIALKLAEMFQNGMSENDYKAENKHQHEIDQRMKREIRALCLRHNGVTQSVSKQHTRM
ncbi:uncharacterized protein LOC109611258 [Ooceraea biroi]|uniref:uncharacterized protein LOC109611258 n=1 Tax=Ooceraea biroi TaxID=2015173 RepID=UPI000971713F|nr:uncharacterized protein LOC109611258 [Ooceraea biroi]